MAFGSSKRALRRALAGLASSGGLIALIAFVLPWVVVTCQDREVARISPYQVATDAEPSPEAGLLEGSRRDRDARHEPVDLVRRRLAWLFALLPALVMVLGVWIAVRNDRSGPPLALGMAAAAGLALTVARGMRDHLGLALDDLGGLEATARVEIAWGAWLAVGGHTLALAVAALLVALPPDVSARDPL